MWRWLRCLVLVTVFMSPWCFGLVSIGDNRVSSVDVLGVVCIAVFLVFVPGRRVGAVYYVLLIYILVALISLLRLIDDAVFPTLLVKWGRLWAIMGAALLAGILPRRHRHAGPYVRAFYWGGLISVVYGIAAFYFQWSFGTAVQGYYYDTQSYLRRAGGVFQDSSAFGHLLATWSAVHLLFARRDTWKSAMGLVMTVLVAGAGLYACLSRAAVVHIGVVAACMYVLPRRTGEKIRRRKIWVTVAALCLLAVAVDKDIRENAIAHAVFTTDRILQPFISAFQGIEALDDSGGRRISTWSRAIEIWTGNPALGIGYKALVSQYAVYCDNTMLLALVETGLLGALCLGVGLGMLFWASVRAYLAGVHGSREVLIFLIGQAVHSMLVDTITFTGSMPVVFVVAMVAYVNQRSSHRVTTAEYAGTVVYRQA